MFMSKTNIPQNEPAKWIFGCLPILVMFTFGVIHYLHDRHYVAALVYAVIIPLGIYLTIVAVRSKKKLNKFIEDTDASNLKKKERNKILKAYKQGSENSDDGVSQ